MKTFLSKLVAVFVVVVFSAVSFCPAGVQFVVTDLGTLGGNVTSATAINDCGQITGSSSLSNGSEQPFLWVNGNMQAIGSFNSPMESFSPVAINNSGQIAGNYQKYGLNHAYLYSNGEYTDLGSLSIAQPSYATGINDFGKVVGGSNTTVGGLGITRAFLYSNGSMKDLGALSQNSSSYAYGINNNGKIVGQSGGVSACFWNGSEVTKITTAVTPAFAYDINNRGQIVGSVGSPFSGTQKAFLYENGQTTLLNGPGIAPYISSAKAINNAGQIVGQYKASLFSPERAVLWGNDNIATELPLNSVTGINNRGQIVGYTDNHSYLLTPVGNCQSYQVKAPTCAPIERLAKWDGLNWVSVNSGDLSSGNIHVLVHGWGPGLRTFSNNGGKIWDEKDPKTGEANSQYSLLEDAAKAINLVSPGDKIVAFNWLDMSATDTNSPLEAKKSRDKTDKASADLTSALRLTCNFAGSYDGKLQLLGVSHGARVAAMTTKTLYNKGNDGSIVIDQLTLGDSPENLDVFEYGPSNDLDTILRGPNNWEKLMNINPPINIGRSPGTTFVDNYLSLFGQNYTNDVDIVNVQLHPDSTWGNAEKHQYPIDWYSRASRISTNLALGWSPLEGDAYKNLASSYEQDSFVNGTFDPAREFILKESDTGQSVPIRLRSNMQLATLLTQGTVAEVPNGKLLTEASPAYWHMGFTKNPEDTTIEFSYQFLNPGDGDELGLWVDDELRFVITGELVGTMIMDSDIDISGLSDGEHILSVALHSYGEANANVKVFDFAMLSVPEPSTLFLLCMIFSAAALVCRKNMRQKIS